MTPIMSEQVRRIFAATAGLPRGTTDARGQAESLVGRVKIGRLSADAAELQLAALVRATESAARKRAKAAWSR